MIILLSCISDITETGDTIKKTGYGLQEHQECRLQKKPNPTREEHIISLT